jgi:capsular polysaccharide biosynthesis protein
MICILSVIVAFFVAVFLAFFLEYLNRLKTEEPDRYQQLKDGLRLRRRKKIRQD